MRVSVNRAVRSLAFAGMLGLIPAAGSAQAVTKDQVIADLLGDGFMVVDTGTTLLGRLRITAMGPEGTREVILNPRNGKVLRDVIIEDAPDKPLEIASTAIVEPVVTKPLPSDVAPSVAVETVAHVAVAEPAAAAAVAAPAAAAGGVSQGLAQGLALDVPLERTAE